MRFRAKERRKGAGWGERRRKLVGGSRGWKRKKGKKTAVSGYEKEISFGGVEAEEEEEKKDGKEAVRKR